MGVGTLLRRRLLTHPVALVAVATSVLMSMVVVATLQLLSAAIADASVRTTLDVAGDRRSAPHRGPAPGRARRRRRAGPRRPGGRGPGCRRDAHRHRHLPRHRAAAPRPTGPAWRTSTTSQGAPGSSSGAWPTAPGRRRRPGRRPARGRPAGGGRRGARRRGRRALALVDLVDRDAELRSTSSSRGTFRPTGVDEGLWVDDPLGLAGVATSDFTSYGPFVVAPGTFDSRARSAPRRSPGGGCRRGRVTTADLGSLRDRVAGVVDGLRRTAGLGADGTPDPAGAAGGPALRDVRVASSLPDLLDRAALVSERVRVSLLTPTVLLVVLGTASLVVAAALLASLRESETRLMRARGASTRQLGLLALADAALVVLLGSVGAVLLAPAVSAAVARAAGLVLAEGGVRSALTSAPLWLAVVPMAVLATVVIVSTTLRVGRARDALRLPVRAGSCACSPAPGSTSSSSASGPSRSCSCGATTRPARRPSTP